MKAKIIVTILIIALVGLGWYAYATSSKAALNTNATSTVPVVQQPEWIPSVSFACADKNHFIAAFPNGNELQVVVDGNVVRTLPRVTGDGQRFEDSAFLFVFAGEEANVTTKATNKTTACTQPVDPNNAPYNFGDAAEGGGAAAQPDLSALVSTSIAGKWKSNEDAKFTREFKADGKINDIYDGKVVSSGTWAAFTSVKAAPIKVSFPVEAGVVYVQMTTTGAEADTLNFKVMKVTPETLELVYMDRGNLNTFTRVQ